MNDVVVKPIEDYPQKEKINLSVELNLTDEMCNAKWNMHFEDREGMDFPLGDDFCLNVTKICSCLFTDVKKIDEQPSLEADATLTPKIINLIRTRPRSVWGEQITTIIVEWSLKNKNGDVIWLDTITAQGKGEIPETQKQVQALFDDLFHQTFDAISSSIEIRHFAEVQKS